MVAFLTVRHLSKSYSGVQALEGVDIDVHEGEVLGLVGPNGSGKTTLFNCLTGFARPNSGRILWRGDDITSLAPDQIARRGLVRTFQQTMVFTKTTVRENVEMAWQWRRSDGNHQAFDCCDDILGFLGLATFALGFFGLFCLGLRLRLDRLGLEFLRRRLAVLKTPKDNSV